MFDIKVVIPEVHTIPADEVSVNENITKEFDMPLMYFDFKDNNCKLNKDAYEQLINEDIDWITKNTKRDLERDHIINVLKESVKYHYPDNRYCDGTFKEEWLQKHGLKYER